MTDAFRRYISVVDRAASRELYDDEQVNRRLLCAEARVFYFVGVSMGNVAS